MPTRETPPAGAPCWLEIGTSDSQRTRDFYSALFDWTVDGPHEDMGGYLTFMKEGVRVAGGMTKMQEGVPDLWSVYLATDDIAKSLETATQAGGTVHVPAMDVMDLGKMAFLTDPAGGAMIGLWQPGTHKGFGEFGSARTPGWFELHTREYDGTLRFYREVFGWQTEAVSDDPNFRYTTFGVGGAEQLGGVIDDTANLPSGIPSHWRVYFAVADTSATIDRLTALGGTVEQHDPDTPYGDLAVAVDPTGAQFSLVGPNDNMPMS
jgi:predicted enzyme related to lactoylglutathione lyase